jgi:hypothetical protein
MGGENLPELAGKQAEIISGQAKLIERQAETIGELEAQTAGLKAPVQELKAAIARLQKDSGNSSKPPSSDTVKAKPAAAKESGGNKRKIGGQPGHKKHERTPFPRNRLTGSLM